jgi:hypothetical protein
MLVVVKSFVVVVVLFVAVVDSLDVSVVVLFVVDSLVLVLVSVVTYSVVVGGVGCADVGGQHLPGPNVGMFGQHSPFLHRILENRNPHDSSTFGS